MSYANPDNEIDKLKNKIINIILLFGSILGLITFFVSLFNLKVTGFNISYITDSIVVSIYCVVAIFRNRIGLKPKSFIIIIGLLILILTDIVKWGIFSDNKILLVVIPFFAFLAYDLKRAIYIYILCLLTIILIGYLQFIQYFKFHVDFTKRVLQLEPWIINILLLTAVSFIIIIIVQQFYLKFFKLINDLKKKNNDLTESEQNYREIFNASTDAIFIHDMKGKILDVNDSMLKMYGYERNDIEKLDIADLSSGDEFFSVGVAIKLLQETMEKGQKVFDWQAKKKSGEFFWVEVALKKTYILNDERILAVIRDIDEKKKNELQLEKYKNHLEELVKERTEKLEETNEDLLESNDALHAQRTELQSLLEKLQKTQRQLIHSEKMASLGILSAGVAHEINNPLNFIKGGLVGLETYFSENKHKNPEDIKTILNAINVGIARAAEIVMSLNHFSRQETALMEPVSIHSIIDNCLLVLHNQMKKKVLVAKDYCNPEPSIIGNDGKLHQAILNILTNAAQAIDEQGTIEIKTEIIKNKIVLSVIDSGVGISAENLKKITEPFFTTKDPGEGTGLGLSIAYNIITEHSGVLEFKSEQDLGTTVKIKLPINTKIN